MQDRRGAAATAQADQTASAARALPPLAPAPGQQTFFLTLKEGPAIGDCFRKISYRGDIREEADSCFISFPGKYASGWEALTKEYHGDSVACVFLCSKDDGHSLGCSVHSFILPHSLLRTGVSCRTKAWANMHRTRATRAAATAREFMASGDGRSGLGRVGLVHVLVFLCEGLSLGQLGFQFQGFRV